MAEKIYVNGFRWFDKKDNQPKFVLGAIVLTPEDLTAWANANADKTSEYNGKAQIKFQVKKSKDGKVYAELDTWKPGAAAQPKTVGVDKEDFPF